MANTKIQYVEMVTLKENTMRKSEMDILYTAKEVAKILKVNVDYVYKLRKSGILPFLKMGQYKCRRSALLKFLEDYEGKDITNPDNIMDLEEGK